MEKCAEVEQTKHVFPLVCFHPVMNFMNKRVLIFKESKNLIIKGKEQQWNTHMILNVFKGFKSWNQC